MPTPLSKILRTPPLWLSVILAIGAGVLYDLAFPDVYFWPASFLAIAVLFYALEGKKFWGGLLLGAVFFSTFFGVHIFWMTLYLGPVPWLALVFAMTLSGSLGMGLTAWFNQVIAKNWGPRGNLYVFPLVAGALWVVREGVASRFPYGGFSWGRFSFAHSDSPFSHLLTWIGSAGLAFLGVTVVVFILRFLLSTELRPLLKPIPVVVLVLLPLWPQWSPVITGEARIAAVQGDADAALNSNNPRGTILKNHYDATVPLLNEEIDLLIWPENAADLDPLRNELARETMNYLTETLNAPMVVGTITVDGDDIYNSALLWEPGRGAVDQYDKIHPVPFAEYMPNREFFMLLAPDLVSLVTRDYGFGERDQQFAFEKFNGGVAICYDIADDDLMHRMILEGAEMILAPTNNADFGETDQNQQQLAIARVRGLESARSVVNISTVGTSAIFSPDGSLMSQLEPYTPGAMVEHVPIATGITPAIMIRWYFEALVGFVLVCLAGVLLVITSKRKRQHSGRDAHADN